MFQELLWIGVIESGNDHTAKAQNDTGDIGFREISSLTRFEADACFPVLHKDRVSVFFTHCKKNDRPGWQAVLETSLAAF